MTNCSTVRRTLQWSIVLLTLGLVVLDHVNRLPVLNDVVYLHCQVTFLLLKLLINGEVEAIFWLGVLL